MITTSQMKNNRVILTAGYLDFNKKLGRYASSRTSGSTIGEDLVQNTFLKTWTYLVKGGKIKVMEAFLYHILKGLIIDEYRKRKTSSLDNLMDKGFDISADDTGRMADVIDGQQVVELIHSLPLSYRQVMRMRYVQDLSLEEISLLTGQSKNTTAVKIHRGLTKLRTLITELSVLKL